MTKLIPLAFHLLFAGVLLLFFSGIRWTGCGGRIEKFDWWVAAIPAGVYALLMSIFGVWFL